ncbi:LysR family transcriptional regulator [Leptothoe spongobia]|uniref:LysR family transcriptional regulator n=1 Tax=Leptothoe spongobia TAU-MAC 1115 TaxID=1967444 RepID=A0A947GMC5_9CYAN|nr:LysR family transcriptional regulator [Leptothoe spongobia]MBT9317923.1 LysR family transcriptional regulator [Leptothoe spongobia TAU-MAC 1115]
MKSARWHELEFRHLEYAIAIKNHQGFLQAAMALELDQGFLSRQIKRLESRLGFQLFDRTTRPLGLTEAGQAFLTRAEQIIEQTKKAVDVAKEAQSGQWGRLDVGINTSIANSKLPEIIQTFREQFSNVNLVLHELASYVQIEWLQNHQIDVGFFHKHNLQNVIEEDSDLFLDTLVISESLVLVLPEKHPLAKKKYISLIELDGKNFILPPHTLLHGLRAQIDQLCISASCKPIVIQEAAWMTTVLSLVAGNMGVSLLPANVKNLQRAGVIYRDIKEPSPALEIVAVRKAENNSAIVRNFLSVVENLSGS